MRRFQLKPKVIEAEQITGVTANVPKFAGIICKGIIGVNSCGACEKCKWYSNNDVFYTLSLKDGSSQRITTKEFNRFVPEVGDYFCNKSGNVEIIDGFVFENKYVEER